MLFRRFLQAAAVISAAALVLMMTPSCGGGVDPTLGARLIFEEEISDGLTGQIILQDMDLLGDDEEDKGY